MIDPDFGVKVKGNFGQLHDGDTAYAVNQTDANPGDLVVLKFDNGEISIRRLYEINGTRVFVPEGPLDYPPLVESVAPCKIIGKVIGVEFNAGTV